MDGAGFSLRLADQCWPSGSRKPDSDLDDATSHGRIELWIAGVEVAVGNYPETDYGINQSAVRLLQTLFADHAVREWKDTLLAYDPVIYCGCTILGTCPNGAIDYRVRHGADGTAAIDQVVAHNDPRRFAGLAVTVPLRDYARDVVVFAEQALAFLGDQPRGDDWEQPLYARLKQEHEFLLPLGRRVAAGLPISLAERARATAFRVPILEL